MRLVDDGEYGGHTTPFSLTPNQIRELALRIAQVPLDEFIPLTVSKTELESASIRDVLVYGLCLYAPTRDSPPAQPSLPLGQVIQLRYTLDKISDIDIAAWLGYSQDRHSGNYVKQSLLAGLDHLVAKIRGQHAQQLERATSKSR